MASVVLDATGKECPEPLKLAITRIAAMTPGDVLSVLSTDPVSTIDFEAWCLREPHDYLGSDENNGVWKILIEVG